MSGVWATLVILDIFVTIVCFKKGKKVFGWVGVLAVLPPLTFLLVLVPVIGAMTPGKPDSESDQPPPEPVSPVETFVEGRRMSPSTPQTSTEHQRTPSADRPSRDPAPSTRAVMIRSFLREAVAENIITVEAYTALVQRLEPTPDAAPSRPAVASMPTPAARTKPPAAKTSPPAPPTPVAAAPTDTARPTVPPPTTSPKPPPPPIRQPAPVHTTVSTPRPTKPLEPPKPREPSPFAIKRAELWAAFTSDVAVHGLVYIGVLLTFVSVLGFMLFAFKDLPTSAKPMVELLIVLTFFGWAWILQHQNATRVAKAMELLGGMILPLVWFAALVDSAGVPPDAEGDPLVVALVASSLALSGLYWLVSRRFENSMLRFLVWPMIWLAAMGVGFVFKTDEYLVGDAITRLVAPQAALASVAIAASLGFLRWRPESRLGGPTYAAALVGVPSAYLLTSGLSFGDGILLSWPIIVSGVGTVASTELIARHFGWMEKLRLLRPYVYALVGVPLVLVIGMGWGGAIIALSYILLTEIAIRSPQPRMRDVAGAATGVVIGSVLSLAEPGSALVAFGTVSIWAQLRRRVTLDDIAVAHSVKATAALAPIGVVYGLSELTTLPVSLLVVGGFVLVAAAAVGMSDVADDFDSIWFPAAASALGIGAASFWLVDGTSAAIVVATLGVSAITVALGQRLPTGNLWLSAALSTAALAIALDALDASGASVAMAWSIVGALTIVVSVYAHGGSRYRIAPGHLSLLGHVIGVLAFAAWTEPLGFAIAMTGWAVGWAVSFAASEHNGGVDPLEVWSGTGTTTTDAKVTLEDQLAAVAPSMAAMTSAAAAVAIFVEVVGDVVQLAWIGPILGSVAFTYAVLAKWVLPTHHGRLVFTWAAALFATAGVAFSYAEPLAMITAAVAVVFVRLLLRDRLVWLTWVAWLMPSVVATALAAEIGVESDSLAAVTLATAIVMLLAALGADEVMKGRRSRGEFTRARLLQPPAALGAVLIPASVAVLWTAGSSASEWASAVAALAFAAASVMLRRSIWLTATLGSISLAIALYSANAPALGSAAVWSAIGLILLLAAPVVPKLWSDDLAGIGHAVGAVGLAYAYDRIALVVALSAWAVGWVIGVASFELGGPSISKVLERSSSWWDESYEQWTTTASNALPAVMAVAASSAASFVLYEEFVDLTDAQTWFGVVFGALGLTFATTGAHLTRTRLTSVIFGWSGLALAAGGILIAIPGDLAIAVTAALAIATRLIVAKLIPDTWLTWVAWLLPTVALSSLASELGMGDATLGIVPIATGGIMLLGGLLLDGFGSKPRIRGDLIRHEWLVAPSVLGGILMLVGLGSLFATEADTRIEAGAAVALVYATTSLVLRRSIWLTSTLGSIGLALVLDAVNAAPVQSATVWAVLGLVVIASVPVVKGVPQDELAGVGHLLGVVAFAYSFETSAYLIAVTAWAFGWLISVTATEISRPAVPDIFSRLSKSSDEQERTVLALIAAAVPPLLAVITSTAAALALYTEFADFEDARAWTAAVVAGLGLLFAAGAKFVISTKPAQTIFGWSSMTLAAAAVVMAIGEDVPIVVAASAFIVVRVLLIGAVPQTWLSWPAWLMPIVIVMAAGHALGVPGQSTYLLSLSAGAAMLIGSLVFDDVANSRRAIGEGLRTPWLRYPFVIGLLAVPLSLAPVFALSATTVGIASLAAAAGYLLVAVLLRAGSVTFPALGLAAFGVAVLLPQSSVENPWILVVMAATITVWSFAIERLQSQEAAAHPWTRWDLPALTVAHVITVVALLLTLDSSPDSATWIAAGVLSMVIGIWRTNRWWMDAGLLLMIVGSAIAGEPWLITALAIATARGMYGVRRDIGIGRYIDHAIAVAAFVAAWTDLAIWFELSHIEVVSYGSMTAGLVAVVAAILSRQDLAKKDTFALWSALGASGVVAATIAGASAVPVAIDGPWLGIAITLIALTSEQSARILNFNLRYATPFLAAAGWLVVLMGLGLSETASASLTIAVFGMALALLMSMTDRFVARAETHEPQYLVSVARVWAIVTLTIMVVAGTVSASADSQGAWWLVAAGLAFTTIAAATGSRAVNIPRLRTGSGVPALGALAAILLALDVPPLGVGVAMTVVASIATLSCVVLVGANRDSGWIGATVVTSIAATLLAVPAAITEYPATELAVLIVIAIGGQAIAYGVVFKQRGLIAIGPPMLGLAAIVLAAESASGSALWYAVPIAVVMLAEADILRPMMSNDSDEGRSVALLVLEWSGIALIGLPPLAEMFTTNLAFGLIGFALAVGLMAWALLTKVKRRVLAACVVATSSAMLSLAAAAASNVQDSAGFWIIGGGIGLSIMLIAGFVEAYRSRSGALMNRLGDLMEDWE